MGFLNFLKSGGGGIISSVLGGGMGLIGGAINAKTQKKMQEASFQYGREMMEKQNQAELQRMGLQFDSVFPIHLLVSLAVNLVAVCLAFNYFLEIS